MADADYTVVIDDDDENVVNIYEGVQAGSHNHDSRYYTETESDSLLDAKVDKVEGKGLSTNDYTTEEKARLASTSGTNTGDQDLSAYATDADLTAGLATKANTSHAHAWGMLTGDLNNQTDLIAAFADKADASDLASYALLASPTFTGSPTAPTQVDTDNSTKLANTEFVQTAIADLVATAPGTLDTLNELAAALGDDPNFATTVTNALATKAATTYVDTQDALKLSLSGGTMTGALINQSVLSTAANNSLTGAQLIARDTSGNQQIGIRSRGNSAGIGGGTFPMQMVVIGVGGGEIYTASSAPLVLGTNTAARLTISGAGVISHGTAVPYTTATSDLGSSSLYWSNTYTQRLYLNSSAYLDGATAGQMTASGQFNIQNIGGVLGNKVLTTSDAASAVNYLTLSNAATGGAVSFQANGADTNVDITFKAKGSGTTKIQSGVNGFSIANFVGTASAVNYLYFQNASTGNRPLIQASGTDTNINLELRAKGTGTVYSPNAYEVSDSTKGIILKSPDGTRYRITVANGGTLSVAAA